jgi:hypothetical protein
MEAGEKEAAEIAAVRHGFTTSMSNVMAGAVKAIVPV